METSDESMVGEKPLSNWVMDLMFEDRRQQAVKVLAGAGDRSVKEWQAQGNWEVRYAGYEQMLGRVGQQDLDTDAYIEVLCDLPERALCSARLRRWWFPVFRGRLALPWKKRRDTCPNSRC
jgi:hypothetical protein